MRTREYRSPVERQFSEAIKMIRQNIDKLSSYQLRSLSDEMLSRGHKELSNKLKAHAINVEHVQLSKSALLKLLKGE